MLKLKSNGGIEVEFPEKETEIRLSDCNKCGQPIHFTKTQRGDKIIISKTKEGEWVAHYTMCRPELKHGYKSIDDSLFIKEMRVLWQESKSRRAIGRIIREYFGDERAEPIINKMQEKIG